MCIERRFTHSKSTSQNNEHCKNIVKAYESDAKPSENEARKRYHNIEKCRKNRHTSKSRLKTCQHVEHNLACNTQHCLRIKFIHSASKMRPPTTRETTETHMPTMAKPQTPLKPQTPNLKITHPKPAPLSNDSHQLPLSEKNTKQRNARHT